MKKKILLLCIIIFPSLIYFVFELTQANFKKMAYFGPKTVDPKGDTVYYRIPHIYLKKNIFSVENRNVDPETGKETITEELRLDSTLIDTSNFPVYVVLFLDLRLYKEGYKLAGIYDYIKYKAKDLKDIPVIVVSDLNRVSRHKPAENLKGDFDSLKINLPNFYPFFVDLSSREKLLSGTYFKGKPVHVFDYFMVLVDKKRHVRGYYDPSYNAEIKRMIQEYKHLKIRDEYAQTLKKNDIKQNDK